MKFMGLEKWRFSSQHIPSSSELSTTPSSWNMMPSSAHFEYCMHMVHKFIHKSKKLIFGNTRKCHFRNLLPETPRVLETLAMVLNFKTCFPHNWKAQGKVYPYGRCEAKELVIQIPHPSFLPDTAGKAAVEAGTYMNRKVKKETDAKQAGSWLPFFSFHLGHTRSADTAPWPPGNGSLKVLLLSTGFGALACGSLRNSLQKPPLTGTLLLLVRWNRRREPSIPLCLLPTGPLLSGPLVSKPSSVSREHQHHLFQPFEAPLNLVHTLPSPVLWGPSHCPRESGSKCQPLASAFCSS